MYRDDMTNSLNRFNRDEFSAKGIFSIDPTLSFIQELLLEYLKELAFYLLKLNDLGINNQQIADEVVEVVLGIIADTSYTQREFHQITDRLIVYIKEARKIYTQNCEQNKVEVKTINPKIKHHKKYNLLDAIAKGEKQLIKKINSRTSEQRILSDILFFLIKCICLGIMQVKRYKKNYNDAYITMLHFLYVINSKDLTQEKLQTSIKHYIKDYKLLIKTIYSAQEEFYGLRENTIVSCFSRQGKAILVSGIDLTQLELVLEATKDRGIDVYTHGVDMLMAHTFQKFKKYTNLVGHFGKDLDNCIIDFAAFPGVILMSRQIFQKIEYLHRGCLFTMDNIVQYGIIKIKNDDLEPLIKSAERARGFTKDSFECDLNVGYYNEKLGKKINSALDKMEAGEIEHLYIVGLLNHETEHLEYFSNFYNKMPKNHYAFSLAYGISKENVLEFDFLFDNLFVYRLLDEISNRANLDKSRITIYIPSCNQYTVSDIIRIIDTGIQDIYLGKCPSTLVNPLFIDELRNTFKIKEFY